MSCVIHHVCGQFVHYSDRLEEVPKTKPCVYMSIYFLRVVIACHCSIWHCHPKHISNYNVEYRHTNNRGTTCLCTASHNQHSLFTGYMYFSEITLSCFEFFYMLLKLSTSLTKKTKHKVHLTCLCVCCINPNEVEVKTVWTSEASAM